MTIKSCQVYSVPAFTDQVSERGKGGAKFGSYCGQSGRRGGRADGGRSIPPPHLPCSKEKIVGFLEQWVSNKEETLPPVSVEPSVADKVDDIAIIIGEYITQLWSVIPFRISCKGSEPEAIWR